MSFITQGPHVLCGCGNGTVQVVQLEVGRIIQILAGHQGSIEHLAVDADTVIGAGDRSEHYNNFNLSLFIISS